MLTANGEPSTAVARARRRFACSSRLVWLAGPREPSALHPREHDIAPLPRISVAQLIEVDGEVIRKGLSHQIHVDGSKPLPETFE